MLFAMISVKKTSTELMMFGSNSENITRSGVAPCEIDASTNSFSRSDSTCRAGRPTRNQNVRDDEAKSEAAALDVHAEVVETIDSKRRADAIPSCNDRGRLERSKNREITKSIQPPK